MDILYVVLISEMFNVVPVKVFTMTNELTYNECRQSFSSDVILSTRQRQSPSFYIVRYHFLIFGGIIFIFGILVMGIYQLQIMGVEYPLSIISASFT